MIVPEAGCGVKEGASTVDTEAISETLGLTTSHGTTIESTSGDDSTLRRFYGAFHPKEFTAGLKWEQPPAMDTMLPIWWTNVVIYADFTLVNEYYYCGGPPEIQKYAWEPDGDGIRVVPSNGEGVPFTWSADQVADVSIAAGEACGEIVLTVRKAGQPEPYPPKLLIAGQLCTKDVSQTSCEFEFTWCDGPPESPICE